MLHNLGDPSKSISSVKFTSYSGDEVRRLSVKQVTNPRSLDILLNPTDGGLYDAAFGAADRDDLCSTCGLGSVQCAGHVGHIDLPVPVYHPLHFKTIHSLLRGSCFKCKKLLIPRDKVILFARQLEAVENGLISSVDALQEAKNELMERVVTASSDVGSMQEIQDCLNEAYMKQVEKNEGNQKIIAKRSSMGWSRNATDFHLELVGRFTKLLTKGIKKCPHCGAYVQTVRAEHNSKFYLNEGKADDDKVTEAMQVYLTPNVVKQQITELWYNEKDVLSYIFASMVDTEGAQKADADATDSESKCHAMDVFFLQTLLVPPSRFRPLGSVNDMQFENPQTTAYTKVIMDCRLIHMILKKLSDKENDKENEAFTEVMEEMNQTMKMKNQKMDLLAEIPGDSLAEKFQNVWHRLQQHVNVVIDSDLDRLNKQQDSGRVYGIKQILEKKDGLFRKNMMGKRVNYAARSVISPDPYIATNEIGVPLVFATKLTYPAPVTPWNLQQLRQAVINGPKVHPGATHVISNGKTIILSPDDQVQREAIAKQLVASSDAGEEDMASYQPKTVLRHIQGGDVMLVNRQPTLHKGSIMAHKVRVLPGEKTLRLHYANCKSYNADFDGDEMNAHFPQNELCRAEAYGIMLTDRQYLSGKDGKPLSGLMQDHMVAGVAMSVRGRFFTKDEYTHLLYNALMNHKKRIKLLPPTIIKPKGLWSGKQIFSTILLNLIPDDKPLLNLTGKSKIGGKNWQRGPSRPALTAQLKPNEMCESQVIIRNGELLCGVLDKAHYGASEYGLIHAIFELYGGDTSGRLLTSLARLFTAFLQFFRGFTLGVEDILVTTSANDARRKTIETSRAKGVDTIASALNVGKANRDDVIMVKEAYENAHLTQLNPTKASDDKIAVVDHSMKKVGNDVNDNIVKSCMGDGLLKTFPENNLQLMVISGAKGGAVNCYQISCLLGQIELEGKRPPLMLSGRSCPSFKPYDTTLRAGGFVSQRFLTGIRPQEYFFHCMAGREGLIDTAVKTSRSGYLQRCLIKHLEGLMMSYDMTVRDSDGSIIQFMYGEDGIDVTKSSCLKEKQADFIVDNHLAIAQGLGGLDKIDEMEESSKLKSKWRKYERAKARMERKGWALKQPRSGTFLDFSRKSKDITDTKQLVEKYRKLSEEERENYCSKDLKIRMADTIISQYRADHYFGSISDRFRDRLTRLKKTNPNLDVENPGNTQLTLKRLETLMKFKYQRSLCEPGESVGLVAAQSVGEPSTQMTLNTFHFAGRGDMNVTLGIPRLREILMVASRQIKTPQITVPIRYGAHEDGEELCRSLTKVRLSKVMNRFKLEEKLVVIGNERYRKATMDFQLVSSKTIHEIGLTRQRVIKHMEKRFFGNLITSLSKQLKKLREEKAVIDQRVAKDISRRNKKNADDEEEFEVEKDGDDKNEDTDDEDGESAKKERKKDDEGEDDEEEDSDDDDDDNDGKEENNSDDEQGGGKEEATVDEGSNRDLRISAVMRLFHEGTKVLDYQFDPKHKSCQLVVRMPMTLDINTASVIRQEVERSCVRQVRGITRAIMVDAQPGADDSEDRPKNLVTEGINFTKMFENQHILDVNKLYSNCVHSMASVYGIEAARRVIVKEITNVFAVYGIEVDPRHLGLIADYMCNEGSYKAFNRQSMISCASPLQQMSFETTMRFLNSAALHGSEDTLQSPSARIVTGQVVKGGTGHFDLIYPIGGGKPN